jgi:hypothetical protein
VVVVQGDERPSGLGVEVVEEADQHVFERPGVSLEQLGRLAAEFEVVGVGRRLGCGRVSGLQGRDEVAEEAPWVGVLRIQGQLRDARKGLAIAARAVGGVEPPGEERGLAEPSWCCDQHEPRCRVTGLGVVVGQLVEEACAGDERSTSGRYPKLGAQRKHGVSVGPGLRDGGRTSCGVRNAPDAGLTGRGRWAASRGSSAATSVRRDGGWCRRTRRAAGALLSGQLAVQAAWRVRSWTRIRCRRGIRP